MEKLKKNMRCNKDVIITQNELTKHYTVLLQENKPKNGSQGIPTTISGEAEITGEDIKKSIQKNEKQ